MIQMGKYTGKVAVVTASTYEIGRSIAERLASEGAKVMISSRKQENVDNALSYFKKKGLPVSGMVCHVAKEEQRQEMIEQTMREFGGIDMLVSNAAVNPYVGPVLGVTESHWNKIFDVNVKSTFFLIKEIVPYMEKRGYICKCYCFLLLVVGVYALSKTTLLGMVKVLATQLSTMNIRINCIAPGLHKTHFGERFVNSEHSEYFLNRIAMKRFGEVDECSGITLFLLSSDASYITGETILITGGTSNRL